MKMENVGQSERMDISITGAHQFYNVYVQIMISN